MKSTFLAACVMLAAAAPAPTTDELARLSFQNDLLKKRFDLANSKEFYLVLDPSGKSLELMYKAALLQAYPTLRATLFDLAATIERAKPLLARVDLLERCQLVGGDFFHGVPAGGDDWVERAEAGFRAAYEGRFGTVAPRGVEVEILTWRVNARGRDPEARLRFAPHAEGDALTGSRRAWFPDHGYVEAAVHDRYRLRPGDELHGPALVEERESTLVVPPG